MALNTNFNVNPYYDDFDETKKYLRLLFKPGYAVQARELTQLQTILQKQVERFGNHIFQNGSVVTGGQFFLQDATYLKLSTTYNGTDINANNFVGMTILSTDETKRAEVIKAYAADAGTGDPITLMVKQVYGSAFTDSETIKTSDSQITALRGVAAEISDLPLLLDESSLLSIGQLRARARRLKKMHNIGIIFVDYLQLLTSGTDRARESRQVEVSEISRGLKALAMELNIPVVVLAQLNRKPEETNQDPALHHLRESGSIEQDADVVMLLDGP